MGEGLPSPSAIESWVDDARDCIYRAARARSKEARDFAATLVFVVSDGENTVFAHVGDGCVVVRERDSGQWIAGTWPDQGEYASTTTFVTDQPMAKLRIAHHASDIDVISLFSDGIERMVLDMVSKRPAERFFNVVAQPVIASNVLLGKDAVLSRQLKAYLGGEHVCARTDDDKSLVIAVLR